VDTSKCVILLLLVESLATGFLLGLALLEGTAYNKASAWIFPLFLGFGSGVGAWQATLVALRNCQTSTKTRTTAASAH
jgi:hypothetical protein